MSSPTLEAVQWLQRQAGNRPVDWSRLPEATAATAGSNTQLIPDSMLATAYPGGFDPVLKAAQEKWLQDNPGKFGENPQLPDYLKTPRPTGPPPTQAPPDTGGSFLAGISAGPPPAPGQQAGLFSGIMPRAAPAPQVIPRSGPVSRSYVPYAGDPMSYGMGPAHNFFDYGAQPGSTAPATVPVPPSSSQKDAAAAAGLSTTGAGGTPILGGAGGGVYDTGGQGGGGQDSGNHGMDGRGGVEGAATQGAGAENTGGNYETAAVPDSNARGNDPSLGFSGKDAAKGALSGIMGGPIGMALGAITGGIYGGSTMGIGKGDYTNSGTGPTTADVDAALAAAAAKNAADTTPADPVSKEDRGYTTEQLGALSTDTAAAALAGISGVSGATDPNGDPGADTGGNMGGNMGGGFGGGFAGGAGDVAGPGGEPGQKDGGRVGMAGGGLIRRGLGSRGGIKVFGGGGSGFIHAASGGRADAIKASAPKGSYVVPADVVSGAGQGNSLAGAKVFSAMKASLPQIPATPRFARGGNVDIKVSGGEDVWLPHEVAGLGGGSRKRGADKLDQLVSSVRASTIAHAKRAPKPR